MAESKRNRMSQKSVQEKVNELEYLRTVRRQEVAERLKEAREQGDLSENAEYDAAKEEQWEVESRIEELENALENVEIYDKEESDEDSVHLGSFVRVYDMTCDEEMELEIVDTAEANSLKWKISDKAPAGKALLQKRSGDVVAFEAPAGIMQYKVLEVA